VVTPVVVAASGLALTGWGALAVVSARRLPAALVCAALLMPIVGFSLLEPLGIYAASRSSRDMALTIPPGTKVVAAWAFRTSLPFYLRRPLILLSRDAHELTSHYVMAMHNRFTGGAYLQPRTRLAALIAENPDALVLANPWQEDDVLRRAQRSLVPVYRDRRCLLLRPEG
jgi:hypothetical protein